MPASDSAAREPARPAPPGSRRDGGAQRWSAPSYLSSAPSCTAEGVGGRRRGLPARWANSLARWPPLSRDPRPDQVRVALPGSAGDLNVITQATAAAPTTRKWAGRPLLLCLRRCGGCWREAGRWKRKSLYSLGDWPMPSPSLNPQDETGALCYKDCIYHKLS